MCVFVCVSVCRRVCVGVNVHEPKSMLHYSMWAVLCYHTAARALHRQRPNTIFVFQGLNASIFLFSPSRGGESQLHSNNRSRTGGGRGRREREAGEGRGVFWELNNANREETILLFVCLAGWDPWMCKDTGDQHETGPLNAWSADPNATESYWS